MRVATYIRVSTKEQAQEGFSLSAQTERLEAYCKAQGDYEIVGRYSDEGVSGREITGRNGYKQMMEQRHTWDAILVLKMDRIHRNSRNFMSMIDDLKKFEKHFISATEHLDTSTAMGRFVMDILQRIAQLESEQISERVEMGMEEKARTTTGNLGKRCPFGYNFIASELKGEEGTYVLNNQEATIVKRIFDEYIAGSSMRLVADRLKADGIATKRGGTWEASTIQVILGNPFYAGWDYWSGILRKSAQPPIISIEVFNRAQKRIAESRRRKDKEPHLIIEGIN